MPKILKKTTQAVKPKKIQQQVKKTKPAIPARYYYACGKRKTAVSCVKLYENGAGIITVNKKPMETCFPLTFHHQVIKSPFKLTDTAAKFDAEISVHGSGINSQAEAIRHSIAKALLGYDPKLRPVLKHAGFLTRDARMKERKKYGLKRARRAPQFSKR